MTLSSSTGINFSFPQYSICIAFVVISVVASQFALSAFNVWAKKQKFELSNDVAGIVFGGISLIYSLILAFVIAAVWDDYRDLQKTIEAEADKLNAIIIKTDALPDSIKASVTQNIYNYCGEVVNKEWQSKDKQQIIQLSSIHGLRQQLLTTKAQNKIQENVLSAIDDDLATLSDLRRERLNHSQSQIPGMVWFILDAGSIMMVLFFFFLNVASLKLKRLYLAFLVSTTAMCMFLVYTLDHPFNDKKGISNELYQNIQSSLQNTSNASTG